MGWFRKASQDEPPQKTKTPFPTKQMFILGEHVRSWTMKNMSRSTPSGMLKVYRLMMALPTRSLQNMRADCVYVSLPAITVLSLGHH